MCKLNKSSVEEKTPDQISKETKFYSARAIGGATFLGGPLAGGYMISENFKEMNLPTAGRNALIIGIVSTVLLFGGLIMVPEDIIDKIPRQIIPIAYTAIVWGIVEWKQGDVLRAHIEDDNEFYSGWRAAGVGFASLIVIAIGVFAYVFIGVGDDVYDQYDKKISEFAKNESETLVFYEHIDTESNYALVQELENRTIPKWKENIEILNSANEIENLPSDLADHNQALLKYAELRLEAFELFKKSFQEDTDEYYAQLEVIHVQIEEQLDILN